MSNAKSYDGHLISELGVKRYLNGRRNQQFSNINLFQDVQKNNRGWNDKPCFGCHGTSYRTLRKQATWYDTVKLIDDAAGPVTAGLVDGAKFQTVDVADRLGKGVERTAEGLHLAGANKFDLVGAENMAVAGLLNSTYKALVNFDLNLIDNPLMQIVVLIVDRYLTAVPEWAIEDMLQKGIIEFPEGFDKYQFLSAAKKGISELSKIEEVDQAVTAVNDGAKRFISKQAGKALTAKAISAIASAIATNIAKAIMSDPTNNRMIKRRLVAVRKGINSAKENLGSALVTLLKAQGFLAVSAKASRQLKQDCPKTWGILRHKMQGADMVFFFVQPMIQEYVDRLSILEKDPLQFANVMAALIKDRQAKKIFYP